MSDDAVPSRTTTTPTLAEYQGTVGRWCAVMGKVPDAGPGTSRARAELDAMADYLADQAKLNLDSEGEWRF